MTKLTSVLVDPSIRRELIREKIKEGLQESFPLKSRNRSIEVSDLKVDPKEYSSDAQKQAILRGDTLFETVKGTVRIKDQQGDVISTAKDFTLVRVPWFTPRHTLIVGGNEYSISNMVRAKPGVYARKRANGILEANFNVIGGSNFNVSMDPEKGEPQLEYGTSKIPLYPILRKAGIQHTDIAKKWGKQLADANFNKLWKNSDKIVSKLYDKVIPEYKQTSGADPKVKISEIFKRYDEARMDPEVNTQTLGKGYDRVTSDSLLDASSKVLRIYKNTAEIDDRDNLDFKSFHSVDDFFKERIKLDAREIGRKAIIKSESTPDVKKIIPPGPFTSGLIKFINSSQLAAVPTQTNPMELIDAAMRVTSLGEGGISSERAIPMEARQVHVTQLGALDPIRTPESFRAGIDVRAAMMAKRDVKGNIFVPLVDLKTRKGTYVRAGELQKSVVAFPNQKLVGRVDALVEGNIRKVPVSKVRYQIPHASALYSPATNLIPFLESAQGNRAVMGSKMQVQSLSLIDREEPFVQVLSQTGKTFENLMGSVINPTAPTAGTITKIDKDYIYMRPDHVKTGAVGGPVVKIPYEDNFPFAAKTYLHHNLKVKKGDRVTAGQQLGESNFTKNGILALGKNLRVAYMAYDGANSNDAVVVSNKGAKKMTSERMYKVILPRDVDLTFNREKHRTYYGHGYTKTQYSPIDTDGVVRPGTIVNPGDPVVMGLRKTQLSADDMLLGKLHKSLARPFRENVESWDHEHPGEVVDVVKTPKRIALTIKTKEPLRIGDKIAGRYGNKGVVSKIIPDEQMIKDEKGNILDLLMTPAGVVSRINPSQIIETAVGKVVEKTGKPLKVENFSGRNNVQWAKDLLKQHGLKDKETVYDPRTGKKIPGVMVGRQFTLKLFKSTDTNFSARGVESYDVNQQPAKGGTQSAKVLGRMELDAILSHNARNVLREAATLKSQRNDEWWRNMQLGYPTPPLKTTFATDKFLNMLTGSGVRVHREGHTLSLAPLTDADTLKLSAGEIKDAKLVRAKDLKPERGGLFDPAITGGLKGNKWSHINLAEPVVSPVFREPVRRFLGMTNTQLDKTISTRGGSYIKSELKKLNLDTREKELYAGIKRKSGSVLDGDVKQLKYIKALKSQNLTPDKAYIVSKVPVVPPVVRPILPGKGGQEIIYGDANPLYRDLVYLNNQFKDVKKAKILPEEEIKLRSALHEAVGAVYGLNEPVTSKSKARGHKGFLTNIAGKGSPKYGYFHSKLMRRTQDVAGRGTIVPDTTLGLDEVGLPEEMLWTMYDKFTIKKLVEKGYQPIEAQQLIKDRHPAARDAMLRETKERPVMINRAPTLHRYNMIGAYPIPVPGKTIRVNPFLEKGMSADYDGDSSDSVIILYVKKSIKYRRLALAEGQLSLLGLEALKNADLGMDSEILPGYYYLHIRDFPRNEGAKKLKDNKETYAVPTGLQVFGFSEEKQQVTLCDVVKFSIHHDLQMLLITTESGRTVQVSRDDSLFGLNPITYCLERFSALDHPDWAIPRATKLHRNNLEELGTLQLAVKTHTMGVGYDEKLRDVPLSQGFGWLLGAIAGDGWVTYRKESLRASAVGIASVDSQVQAEFKHQFNCLSSGEQLSFKQYVQPHDYEGFASYSEKLHMYNAPLATAVGSVFDHSRGAINKHLPTIFTQAPREFLIGILAGLIDTDGTVSIVKAKAKKKPQVMAHYTTISPRLADDVATLGLLLGVKTRVHTAKRLTSAGNKEYQVHFSTPDLQKIALELPCKIDYKVSNLKKLAVWDFSNDAIISKEDRIPVPIQFVAPLKKLAGSTHRKLWKKMQEEEIVPLRKIESIQVILSKAKRTGKIGRTTLDHLIQVHGYDTVEKTTTPDWLALVTNSSIIWDWIDDITAIEGKHTAWDLTVPDGNTFMTSNQLIVYDTMMVHTPVQPKAVEDVKKMTLSNLLFGDKSRDELMVFPQHEAIMGISHAAEQDSHNAPKSFKTREDAMKAYNDGKINLGTRVKIGK